MNIKVAPSRNRMGNTQNSTTESLMVVADENNDVTLSSENSHNSSIQSEMENIYLQTGIKEFRSAEFKCSLQRLND